MIRLANIASHRVAGPRGPATLWLESQRQSLALIIPCLTSLLLLTLASNFVFAEHRAALLIGNSNYPNAPLASPSNDIRTLETAFQARGFVVTKIENADTKTQTSAIEAFARSVPTRGTAIVFFSGYALRGGEGNNADNFLLPIDGSPVNKGSVFQAKTGVRWTLDQLQTLSGSELNILLIDGCHAHPRQSKNIDFTLQETPRFPPESLALYAAPFGTVLKPAETGLSPFAAKLVSELGSTKPLCEILEILSPTKESTLEDLDLLAKPASKSIAPSKQLKSGNKAGDEWVNELGMVFCWCPTGSFQMGSSATEPRRGTDEDQKTVQIQDGFWVAKYELTRQQTKSLIGRHTYLSTGTHKLQPLDKCRKDDAPQWLALLNKNVPSDWQYAIPTEEQWEYAARAGTITPFYFGNDVRELARHANFADINLFNHDDGFYVYADKSLNDGYATTAKVGSFQPNPWGLHDVYGNLSEHCETPYESPNIKPGSYPNHVIRGGSWLSSPDTCRSAYRNYFSFGASENIVPNQAGYRFVIKKTPH